MLPGKVVGIARQCIPFLSTSASVGIRRAKVDSEAAAAAATVGMVPKGSAPSEEQSTATRIAAQRLAKELQASGSRLSATLTDAFRFLKETVVGVVKLSDAHLRGLESRISIHETRLKESHAQGDTSGVVHNTDALRQLYMEHKSKLDDMLFFWIFGGAVCVAGWVRLAWVQASRDRARREENAELHVTMASIVKEVVGEMLEQQAAQQQAAQQQAIQQALQEAQQVAAAPAVAAASGSHSPGTNPNAHSGDEPRLLIVALPVQPVDADSVAKLLRATGLAVAATCALSIFANLVGLVRGR